MLRSKRLFANRNVSRVRERERDAAAHIARFGKLHACILPVRVGVPRTLLLPLAAPARNLVIN